MSAIASNQIGKLIDKYGSAPLIRASYPLLMIAAVLFALFCHSTPYAIMFIYMPLSVAVTALSASVSNEMSRVLPKEQIGAGMGLSQLTQFFGGALGVALTGTALVWQKAIPLGEAFSHIFWGMAAVVAVSFLCYVRYAALRSAASSAKSPVQSA